MAAQTFETIQGSDRTLRLTFEFKGADVRLIARQSVDMMAPPSDQIDEYSDHAGFWIELRDGSDRVLYRRVGQNPIATDREAPSGDPQRPFTHVPDDRKQGVFTVLVPDLKDARELRLMGSPSDAPARAAREILRMDLASRPQPGKEER
jgi:hypothetical protein